MYVYKYTKCILICIHTLHTHTVASSLLFVIDTVHDAVSTSSLPLSCSISLSEECDSLRASVVQHKALLQERVVKGADQGHDGRGREGRGGEGRREGKGGGGGGGG